MAKRYIPLQVNTFGQRHALRPAALLMPVLGLGLFLAAALPVHAQVGAVDHYWGCGSGDWTDAGCWNTGAVPGTGSVPRSVDNANLLHGDASDSTVTYDTTPPHRLGNLTIDNGGSGTTTLEVQGGSLGTSSSAGAVIGDTGSGAVRQTGGVFTNPRLYLGRTGVTSVGRYTLDGGELTVYGAATPLFPYTEYVGYNGIGYFDHNGGINRTNTLIIGNFENRRFADPRSIYNLGGSGELHAQTVILGAGFQSKAAFYQSGGTLASEIGVGGTRLQIGLGSHSVGGYYLSDGILLSHTASVGWSGFGFFHHSGGEHDGNLVLAERAGSTGDYWLSGTGMLTTYSTIVGRSGDGRFMQTGGSHVVTGISISMPGMLTLAAEAGGTGTYELSGGHLESDWQIIGKAGYGEFVQSGDSVNTVRDSLHIGSPATGGAGYYQLHGGELSVADTLVINPYGDPLPWGEFEQTGGSLSANGVRNNATFNHTGGSIAIGSGQFINGEAQAAGIDPDARFNIDNTSVVMTGDVLNFGTVKLTDASADFTSGTFISYGPVVSDPSSSFYSMLAIIGQGYLVGGAGDEFFIEGDFLNLSERADLWDTAEAYLAFTGAGPHEFRLAEATDPSDFGWGTLELLAGAELTLTGSTAFSLFVANLVLGDGALLDLNGAVMIVNNLVSNGGTYTNGDIVILPSAVPLPPAWLLLVSGLALVARGRRNKSRR